MFTESMTAAFYDAEDEKYRSFWDPAGSLHWGVFEHESDTFIAACERHDRALLAEARIDTKSRVLDLGCGNGTTSAWLAAQTGAEVVGVDLSTARVANARRLAQRLGSARLRFEVGSATALPFEADQFTHVFSQAVLYHTHDRPRALAEAARVLEPGGLLVFDDLITPRQPVGLLARRYVYDRLLFEPTFSQAGYVAALEQAGFVVLVSRDLSRHLARSYEALAVMAEPEHPELSHAYRHIPEVVRSGEVGWASFVAQKVDDRLAWIYDTSDARFSLAQKYDAWASRYDEDLRESYAASPRLVAELAARHLPPGASILDAGAGTGLVGEALRQRGFTQLTALDQSAGVLARAAAKQVYTELVQGTLEQTPSLFPNAAFDAVAAVGVFTFGHAPPSALGPLLSALKLGGLLLLAVRADYFAQVLAPAETLQQLGLKQLESRNYEIFDGEPMLALVLEKTLA